MNNINYCDFYWGLLQELQKLKTVDMSYAEETVQLNLVN